MVIGFNYLTYTDLIRITDVLELMILAFAAGFMAAGVLLTWLAWLSDKFTIVIERED